MKNKKESKIKKLKELWKDPKGHAVISLCLWAIFFGLIFLLTFINNAFNSNTVLNTNKYSYIYETSNNYEYKITINYNNGNDNSLIINGIRYEEKEIFSINNEEFSIVDNQIKSYNNIDINKLLLFDIISLRPNKLNEYLQKNINNKEIKYKDNSIKKEYFIKATDFNILNNKNIKPNNDQIKITLLEKNNKVIEVNIELINLVKLVNNKTNYYNIKIEYSNIDNISDFDIKEQ